MKTQTKCTLCLSTLFFIELMPIPFTAIYSLYAVRKRPAWLPATVERLYADKPVDPNKPVEEISLQNHDAMKTRRNCTITLSLLFIIDAIVPTVVPLAIYIVRRRPNWFKKVTLKLYADQLPETIDADEDETSELAEPSEVISEILDQKFQELERSNFDFAKTVHRKND